MNSGIDFSQLLLLLAPIIIIQLALQIYALYDLYKQPKVRGPKWVWVLVIILGEILGPIIYFFVGRRET
jgi:hypothetical protein